jgi:hypothetical protein
MDNKTYEVETMENEIHKCTACSCEYTDDEGGVQGDFGILPMSFCPTCLACMLDMAEQLNPREWIGLTDEDWNSTPYDTEFRAGAEWAEAKLMEKNSE